MIGFEQLDLLARGGTLALLGLWAWVLIRDHRRAFAARLALAMTVAISCHVIASIPGPPRPITLLDAALDTASAATIGLFWLFSRAWFEDVWHFRWRSWAIFLIPVALVGMVHLAQAERIPGFSIYWFPLLRSIWFGLAIAGLWVAWRSREGDLVEARRIIRLRLIASIGALCVLVNAVEVAVFAFGARIEWRSVVEIGIMLASLVICSAMFTHRQDDLFATQSAPTDEGGPAPYQAEFAERLTKHMKESLAWRDETLTISNLASQLGEQEYRLRRLINRQLGHRNFAQFLNGYRLAEVKSALADPCQKDVPILTIALDAGFGSLGPFNRAFRDAEGMTPSAYRQRSA